MAENARLTAENAELKSQVESFESIVAEAAKEHEDLSAKLAAAESRAAAAEKAQADAEAKAAEAVKAQAAAEESATKTAADAKAQIDAKEAEVGQRANRMAMDQMAGVGQPPNPDNSTGSAEKPSPRHGGSRSESDAIRLAASHWRKN